MSANTSSPQPSAPHAELLRTWITLDDVFKTPRGKQFKAVLEDVAKRIDADRAVLSALEQPDEAMLRAVEDAFDEAPYDDTRVNDCSQNFAAAIRAALAAARKKVTG